MILIIPLIILLIIFAVRINTLSNELIKLKEENDMLHNNIYNMATKLNERSKKKEKLEEKKVTQNERKQEEVIKEEKVVAPDRKSVV